MHNELTILHLIENGTLSTRMAATLWGALDRGVSFVTVAIPRSAGKSTLCNALLGLLRPDISIHRLKGDESEMDRLNRTPVGGYLWVNELSQAPVPTYMWGAPVRRLFATLRSGYSLAASLHASGFQEAFHVICSENGVGDQDAGRIGLVLYIHRFGSGPDDFQRRLAEIHEIDGVQDGHAAGRLLYRWSETTGEFEHVENLRSIEIGPDELDSRSSWLTNLMSVGRTSRSDVDLMVTTNTYPMGA